MLIRYGYQLPNLSLSIDKGVTTPVIFIELFALGPLFKYIISEIERRECFVISLKLMLSEEDNLTL